MNPYVRTSIKDSIKVEKIVHCLSFELDFKYKDTPESHDFWEFVFVESGRVLIESDGEEVQLWDNDILFHKPNSHHTIKNIQTPKAKMHFISFVTKSDLSQLLKSKINVPHNLKKDLFMLLEEAELSFERVVEDNKDFLVMSQNAPLGSGQLYKMYLEGFLIKLIRFVSQNKQLNKQNENEFKLYQKMTKILADNITSNYDITKLCKQLNYGKTYLSRVFKHYSGFSIMYWYNMQKIDEAKKLILEDKYTLKEISRMTGFANRYYFSRVFKKYEGVSPSEYKGR